MIISITYEGKRATSILKGKSDKVKRKLISTKYPAHLPCSNIFILFVHALYVLIILI